MACTKRWGEVSGGDGYGIGGDACVDDDDDEIKKTTATS